MVNIICRFLMVTVLTLSMQAMPAATARADILDDFANLLDDVGSQSWLPATGDDIRGSKQFIVCLSNADNDVEVLKCIEDFKDTPLGSKIGDQIPSWVYDLITVYIALKEKDYTTLLVYLGKAAACAILQVLTGGTMDICGLIEELVALAGALLDAATAVYEFFKDVGEAVWEGVKDVGCALGIGGCDDDGSPPEVVAYAWVFAPKVLPQGLAAIKAVDASTFPDLRTQLEKNARAKPPVTGDPNLDTWLKQFGYSFPASAVDIASKAYQNAVEAQWKADLAENVLPQLSKARADYGTPSRISALAGPALASASPDGQQFRSLVAQQCTTDLNIGQGFAHVDRWVSAHSMDAVQLGNLQPNRVWCAGDFWSPAVKSEFAKHLRSHVKNTVCPTGPQGFACPTTEKYDACRRLLKAVDIEGECAVDVAKVGKEVAQKIVAELKAKGSTWNYEIREAPPQTAKPAEIVCVRPTQRHACDAVYAARFAQLTPRVVNCGLQMPPAYMVVVAATAAETDKLSQRYQAPFGVDDRDPLFVHAPSRTVLDEVQNDPQQQFKFDIYPIKAPRSVDGLDKPGLGVDTDLKEPIAQAGRDQIKDKVLGFHAGGPIDPLDENPLDKAASPLQGVQVQNVQPGALGAAAGAGRVTASPPGAVTAAPVGQQALNMPGQTATGATQPMSGTLPPGSAPTSPSGTTQQVQQVSPQVRQAQSAIPAGLPDIAPEGQVSVGGMRAPWGHTIALAASRAQNSAGGVCLFTLQYSVRNAGAAPSGAFQSAWKTDPGPAPKDRSWPSLAPGAVSRQSETVGLKPGQNVLTLTLDSRRQVAESNEADNTVRVTIVLSGDCGSSATKSPATAPVTAPVTTPVKPQVKPPAMTPLRPQPALPQRMQLPSAPMKRTQCPRRGGAARRPREPPARRRARPLRRRLTSTSSTVTWTCWPVRTTSEGSRTKRSARLLICTRPSWCTPTSTKAPKRVTLVTMPGTLMPGCRSAMSCTSAKRKAWKAGRGSRPGFSSSARISLRVGSPTSSPT
jgi:hypothetical protein